MLLGFLDRQGRAYDLTFATMKRRVRDSDGGWALQSGESMGSGVSVEAAMFLQTPKSHLLLRPTSGIAYASDRRFLFLAGEGADRTEEEPTQFNVGIHAPRTAVSFLLGQGGGREIVEVRREEFRGSVESRAELTVQIEAPWAGGGVARFLLVLRPSAAARKAVAPLALSEARQRNP